MVVKFVKKAKVNKDSWVKDAAFGQVPLEMFMLAQLDHPNIVTVINSTFYNKYFLDIHICIHTQTMQTRV